MRMARYIHRSRRPARQKFEAQSYLITLARCAWSQFYYLLTVQQDPCLNPRCAWTSLQGANLSIEKVSILDLILNAVGFIFVGLILFALCSGAYTLWQVGEISLIDLYLAFSSLLLFFIGSLIHKRFLNIMALSVILIFFIVKLVENLLTQRKLSWKVFLFSFGIALLGLSLALDMDNTRVITNFPPNQDGLEYQTLAHNIFVKQDVFLAETPPRANKNTFPLFSWIVTHLLRSISGGSTVYEYLVGYPELYPDN